MDIIYPVEKLKKVYGLMDDGLNISQIAEAMNCNEEDAFRYMKAAFAKFRKVKISLPKKKDNPIKKKKLIMNADYSVEVKKTFIRPAAEYSNKNYWR